LTSLPFTPTNSRNHTRGGRTTVILVIRDKQSDFLRIGILIEQQLNPFSRSQLALLVLAIDLVRTATTTQSRLELQKLIGKLAQARRLFCGSTSIRLFHQKYCELLSLLPDRTQQCIGISGRRKTFNNSDPRTAQFNCNSTSWSLPFDPFPSRL